MKAQSQSCSILTKRSRVQYYKQASTQSRRFIARWVAKEIAPGFFQGAIPMSF
jgi:hypothetical protein